MKWQFKLFFTVTRMISLYPKIMLKYCWKINSVTNFEFTEINQEEFLHELISYVNKMSEFVVFQHLTSSMKLLNVS